MKPSVKNPYTYTTQKSFTNVPKQELRNETSKKGPIIIGSDLPHKKGKNEGNERCGG